METRCYPGGRIGLVDLAPLARRIDDHIESHLRTQRASLTGLPATGAPDLIDVVAEVIASGGKRIRPAFCYWGFRAAGGDDGPEIVAAAASLELLHTFALIHDDVMDRSPTRRGAPSVPARYGDAVAILAGDLALVLADACLAGCGLPAERLAPAQDAYNRMRMRVIQGQYLDVTAPADIDAGTAMAIAAAKSGSYTVVDPLLIGGVLAGRHEPFLRAYGEPLGLAFQLRDDILGLFGDPHATGKPVDSDIREGKRNYLLVTARARLDEAGRDLLARRWGAPDLGDSEVEQLRALIATSGARDAVEERISSLFEEALAALQRAGVGGEARAALAELARLAAFRVG